MTSTLRSGGLQVRIDAISPRIARVRACRDGAFGDSALNRYGFIAPPESRTVDGCPRASAPAAAAEGEIVLASPGGTTLLHQLRLEWKEGGTVASFRAQPGEDWVGFGDQTRDRLFHRGHTADCHVRNVRSYVPVPFFMSTAGYGVLVNTTHRVAFDMCASDPNRFEWRDGSGRVDYYLVAGASFREILEGYTWLTGRPRLPPEWSFGLWYICRTQANDYEAVNDALNFRREGIPCDVLGLEPGWMEKNYDSSTQKRWNDERFPIPRYALTGPHNFFNAIQRMGFHMELWLCCDYDLSYEAERRAGAGTPARGGTGAHGFFSPDAEVDEHFSAPRYLDPESKPEEPWFEHLRKFVDQGIDFFKQDGSYQVLDHPDRRWGNGMRDEEMHNLYPLLYARQMLEGFEAHTKRRGLTFTVDGWVGFQAWAGTWTGDTGGRLPTLGAMLNTAMVGHSWATNDMEVAQAEGIHFGYLLPWAQINSWNYFRMPWVQGEKLASMHRDYSRLRARLVPYLYSWAWEATRTGFPLMAPLVMEFQEDPETREILHQYLLGRDLMVVIYKDEAYFPAGRWKDYWSGEVVEGGARRRIRWPESRGGGLYVREGAIVPFGPLMQYRGERPVDEIELYVFPGAGVSSFALYRDDGVSLEHASGAHQITRVTARLEGGRALVSVAGPEGSYRGSPEAIRFGFRLALERRPRAVLADGSPLDASAWSWDEARGELEVRTAAAAPVELETRP
jgi:alpha-glucosidase